MEICYYSFLVEQIINQIKPKKRKIIIWLNHFFGVPNLNIHFIYSNVKPEKTVALPEEIFLEIDRKSAAKIISKLYKKKITSIQCNRQETNGCLLEYL